MPQLSKVEIAMPVPPMLRMQPVRIITRCLSFTLMPDTLEIRKTDVGQAFCSQYWEKNIRLLRGAITGALRYGMIP